MVATTRWKKSNTSVHNVAYHLIWCPKYRRKVLVDKVAIKLKQLILKKAKENEWIIESLEIMPDHVHIFIKANPIASPHWIVQQFKGYTSNILRREFKYLRTKLPTLWTRSYYCESVGHISEDTIKKYIEEQMNK